MPVESSDPRRSIKTKAAHYRARLSRSCLKLLGVRRTTWTAASPASRCAESNSRRAAASMAVQAVGGESWARYAARCVPAAATFVPEPAYAERVRCARAARCDLELALSATTLSDPVPTADCLATRAVY